MNSGTGSEIVKNIWGCMGVGVICDDDTTCSILIDKDNMKLYERFIMCCRPVANEEIYFQRIFEFRKE